VARQLLVQSDVAARYLGVLNAYRAIQVQEQSRLAAREQIRLARTATGWEAAHRSRCQTPRMPCREPRAIT
jgi:outer membrane protein TolC